MTMYDDAATHVAGDHTLPSDYLRAGLVRRYHTNDELAHLGQTNAEHSWGVAVIILRYHPDPSASLIREAILHDLGEYGAADVPGPVKASNPKISGIIKPIEQQARQRLGLPESTLTEIERKWLKFADAAEAYLFGKRHIRRADEWAKGWDDLRSHVTQQAADLGLHNAQIAELLSA